MSFEFIKKLPTPDEIKEQFPLPEALGGNCSGQITLLPSVHDTDGFFICKLRREQ